MFSECVQAMVSPFGVPGPPRRKASNSAGNPGVGPPGPSQVGLNTPSQVDRGTIFERDQRSLHLAIWGGEPCLAMATRQSILQSKGELRVSRKD